MATGIDAFLRRSRQSLTLMLKESGRAGGAAGPGAARRPVQLVMGNESADLDSVASSLVYAAWLDTHNTQSLSSEDADGGAAVLRCPVINIPRADIALRTDVRWILDQIPVSSENLVFSDDPEFAFARDAVTDIVLVDHNELLPGWAGKAELVREIIDHHEDKHLYPAATRTMALCGSCASLVAARAASDGAPLGPDAAHLLLAALHADTAGLTMRVTPEDTAAAAQLTAIASTVDVAAMHRHLVEAKADISSLSLGELLRKDYKSRRFGGGVMVGVSAVVARLEALSHKGDPHEAAQQYARDNGLDVLLIMTTFIEPEFSRQLAVYTTNPGHLNYVCEWLEGNEEAKAKLSLERIEVDGFKGLVTYSQGNTASSRKKLLPLLEGFLSKGLPDQ